MTSEGLCAAGERNSHWWRNKTHRLADSIQRPFNFMGKRPSMKLNPSKVACSRYPSHASRLISTRYVGLVHETSFGHSTYTTLLYSEHLLVHHTEYYCLAHSPISLGHALDFTVYIVTWFTSLRPRRVGEWSLGTRLVGVVERNQNLWHHYHVRLMKNGRRKPICSCMSHSGRWESLHLPPLQHYSNRYERLQ